MGWVPLICLEGSVILDRPTGSCVWPANCVFTVWIQTLAVPLSSSCVVSQVKCGQIEHSLLLSVTSQIARIPRTLCRMLWSLLDRVLPNGKSGRVRFHRFRCRLAWRAKADVGRADSGKDRNTLFCAGTEMQHCHCAPICRSGWERLFKTSALRG